MADSRPKRANAGKNIGKLVNQELGGDDFYSTAYGGFLEESEDEEYETENSEDDQVDSDFDVDESGWGPDDEAETKIQKEEKEKKKRQWIKPYKPLTSSKPPSQPKKPRPKTTLIVTSLDAPNKTAPAVEPRILRKSTQEISRGFRRRQEEEEEQRRKRKVRRPKQVRRLTQQELLEEAKYTEIENIASLEAYYKMEAEKKKVKEKKVLSWTGPTIRYLSLTMPVVEEVGAKEGSAESTEGVARAGVSEGGTSKIEVLSSRSTEEPAVPMETNAPQSGGASAESAPKEVTPTLAPKPSAASEVTTPSAATPVSQESAANKDTLKSATPTLETPQPSDQKQNKQCRNFLVFTDTAHFPSAYFPPCSASRPQKRRRRFCPVTGLPAKYIDPLTHTPYATPFAFKVIRLRYASEAEEKCEKRLAQLSNWLEEKKKRKKMESI